MTCPDCSRAAIELWRCYRSGCRGCIARAIARNPEFAISRAQGRQTRAYREHLEKLGAEHSEVLEAAANDFTTRKSAWGAML